MMSHAYHGCHRPCRQFLSSQLARFSFSRSLGRRHPLAPKQRGPKVPSAQARCKEEEAGNHQIHKGRGKSTGEVHDILEASWGQ